MGPPLHLLIVDDSVDDADLIVRDLSKAMFDVESKRLFRLADIETALSGGTAWDLIICDHDLPGFDSQDVLRVVRAKGYSDVPFLLVSGIIDTDTAVAAMRHGASDFIYKNDLSRLVPAIRRELEEARMRKEKAQAEAALEESNSRLKRTLKTLANTQDLLVAAERFRALGQMSSGIAHDFNNALMKMQGTVEILRERLPESDPLHRQLVVQLGDAATVVRRLCDFYRASPATDETAVDVEELLADVVEFTRPKWQNTEAVAGTKIELEVHHHAQRQAWACASQLREVLTNLVFNACDAMEETAGTILLISRDVEAGVEIEVRDNGSGMTREVMGRCFDPLYTTKGSSGTGLGLAIVQSIIQSYGGTVIAQSELGQGTAMTLTLRAADIAAVAVQAPQVIAKLPGAESRQLKILAVDDEPTIGKMLQGYLNGLGHDASFCVDPLEAVRLFSEKKFDVVLSDRSMPQMSGDELAVKLHELSPETRFVMVSGYGDLMLINGELPDGVDLVVPKPISGDLLREALDSLFPAAESGNEAAVALAN